MGFYKDNDITVPGTEVMEDINSAAKHSKHSSGKDHLVLVPQPSDSLNDPLNWVWYWKFAIMAIQGIFVFCSVMSNLAIAPLTPIYMAEWEKSEMQIALLTGATVMSLGYANFIIVPAAEIFGRRVVMIICALICVGANIWQATATSYASFMGARVVIGLGAAANESLMTMSIADIFFLDARGKYMCFYFFSYFNGLFFGPIISGTIASRMSWRWFFWVCVICQSVSAISLVLFFPETRFRRASQEELVESANASVDSCHGKENAEFVEENIGEVGRIETRSQSVGQGRPNRSQFSLFQPIAPNFIKELVRHTFTPVRIAVYPIVLWAALTMGAAADALLGVNLLQSPALSAPPYNFSPQSVGFANFAFVVGGIIGLFTAGPSSDWIAAILTKRNHGIREPEMRLWALIPYCVITIISLCVVGFGFDNLLSWQVIIIVGFGGVGLITVSIPTISVTYAVDSYLPGSAGPIMIICTVAKNTFGFAMTFFINNWAAKSGFAPPLMMLMGLTAGLGLFGVVFFNFFGKKLRRITQNSPIYKYE